MGLQSNLSCFDYINIRISDAQSKGSCVPFKGCEKSLVYLVVNICGT